MKGNRVEDDFFQSVIVIVFMLIGSLGLFSVFELSKSSYEKAYDPCSYDAYGFFYDSTCIPRSDYFISRLDYVLSKHNKITYGALWIISVQDLFNDSDTNISKFKRQLLLERGIK